MNNPKQGDDEKDEASAITKANESNTNNVTDMSSRTQPISAKVWCCQICTFAENPYTVPVCIVCGALPTRTNPTIVEMPEFLSNDDLPSIDDTPILREESNIDDIFEPNFLRQATVDVYQMLENKLQKAVVEKQERESALEATLKKDEKDEKKKEQQTDKDKTEKNAVFVVEDISEVDHSKITQELSKIDNKEGLINHLRASCQRVETRLAHHEEQVTRLRKELIEIALQYREDKALWKRYAVLELQETCELFYKAQMRYYHTLIDVEIKYAETCSVKSGKLRKSETQISEHYTAWSLEDVQLSVAQAIEVAYSIRLSKETIDKQAQLKLLQKYDILKQQFGMSHVDMHQRTREVINYLTDIITAKRNYDSHNTQNSQAGGDRLGDMDAFVQNVLDEKNDGEAKEGILCKKFVEKLAKNMKNISLEEIFEFIEELLQHFSNESFHISKAFPDKDLTEVQLLVKVLIYTCIFAYVPVVRDALNLCLNADRGKQEYKQLKKVKKYAYFISKIDKHIKINKRIGALLFSKKKKIRKIIDTF
ncbi:hypothetical protein RFI_13451 [Reticulomyxa filosa]|uniref:RanBP2-type domain-containing protein n=1 Tax=Reticulomyxa filosa TaxID=46433 RepID=X6NCV4_RETFI|nr:hypothetical protein RFI_13451 [Reticulomyxa filosa]|eukprot:ETO23728.1 hypothetical protein RFI_13451 [Reticulomyxa filosa]